MRQVPLNVHEQNIRGQRPCRQGGEGAWKASLTNPKRQNSEVFLKIESFSTFVGLGLGLGLSSLFGFFSNDD